MVENLILGVDIGGSHVTSAIVDLLTYTVLEHTLVRTELDSRANADSILEVWTCTIQQTCAKNTTVPKYIGISMPGPFDYENGVSMINGQDKYDALYGLNTKELIAHRLNLDISNIAFMNDAEAFLSGEIMSGAAKNCTNVIGLTLGTGLGSAIALNNRGVRDAELWKMPFKDSIAEEYLSTRWFVKKYAENTTRNIADVKELFSLAQCGEVEALEIFGEFGRNLGEFLQRFIELEGDIDVVVLGGNIAKTSVYFKKEVRQVLGNRKVEIHQAILSEDAALIGAAGIWEKVLFKNGSKI